LSFSVREKKVRITAAPSGEKYRGVGSYIADAKCQLVGAGEKNPGEGGKKAGGAKAAALSVARKQVKSQFKEGEG